VDDDQHAMLARLEERTQSIQRELHMLTGKFNEYVLHIEFAPVRWLVFGLAGLILSAVIAAVVATVIHK
jgi:hypothetical protein